MIDVQSISLVEKQNNFLDPYGRFMYAIRSPQTKKRYPQRFIAFLDYVEITGLDIHTRINNFYERGKDDHQWIQDSMMSFIEFQKKRVETGKIVASTISNYYKPVRLFCDMNNILINWKLITRGIPKGDHASNDRAPTIEEIRLLIQYPDIRIKPIVTFMISSGARIGAWDYLKWKHITPIYDSDDKILAAKVIVYQGDPEMYLSFITPECYKILSEWMDYRAFGHGKEQFFWSFIVATLIFGISGVMSLEQGFSSLFGTETHQLENLSITYVILAISFVFEANALRIAFGIFKKGIEDRGEKLNISTVMAEFKESKDTSVLTVIVEDTAALLGIIIAVTAVYLSDITGNTAYDAIGSLLIGLVLMVFAFFLARENKDLLIGEAMSRRDYKAIYDAISTIPQVSKIISVRTMHFASEDVLIAIEVSLIDDLNTDAIESIIDTIESKVKHVIPYAISSKIYVELERAK